MFCSAFCFIYSTDLRRQELIEEHREHYLMELCKKAAPAQADCSWDLQVMALLQASIKSL